MPPQNLNFCLLVLHTVWRGVGRCRIRTHRALASHILPTSHPLTMKPIEQSNDELQLEALGHRGELQRNFSPLSMLGLAFAILNSWTALSASLSLALPSGGSTSVIWGLITAGICNLALAASLAEFLSAYPTAGGQYVFPSSRMHKLIVQVSLGRCYILETMDTFAVLDHWLDQCVRMDRISRIRRPARLSINCWRHLSISHQLYSRALASISYIYRIHGRSLPYQRLHE